MDGFPAAIEQNQKRARRSALPRIARKQVKLKLVALSERANSELSDNCPDRPARISQGRLHLTSNTIADYLFPVNGLALNAVAGGPHSAFQYNTPTQTLGGGTSTAEA